MDSRPGSFNRRWALGLRILNRIADMPYRLPTTDDGGDPGLAALRIIEGDMAAV